MTMKPKSKSVLRDWRERIIEWDSKCYWPGPRPMRDPGRVDQLIGRNEDTDDIVRLIRRTSLVVLSGESGVGKTSLLNLKVVPHLRDANYAVLLCSEWGSGSESFQNASQFITTKLSSQLPADFDFSRDLIEQLEQNYGESAVIVLDQFEELIRHQPDVYDEVRRWLQSVVAESNIRVVTSLRTEFEHRLRNLRVGPYQRADAYLTPINEQDWIRAIISTGKSGDHPGRAVIEKNAIEEVVKRWSVDSGGRAWSGVGLLHLQALLFVLWDKHTSEFKLRHDAEWAAISKKEVFDLFETLMAGAPIDSTTGTPATVFSQALAIAVDVRLRVCENEFLDNDSPDVTLTEGVKTLIARIARHLSSGGFKVDQDRLQLAELVLVNECRTLGFARNNQMNETGRVLFSRFGGIVDAERARRSSTAGQDKELEGSDSSVAVDWLSARREELLGQNIGLHKGDDPDDSSSGPMLGRAAIEILCEEFRRFFFALEWLDSGNLMRWTPPQNGKIMGALIHDGFGQGLNSWAQNIEDRPGQALNLLTAAVGEIFSWPSAAELDGSNATETLYIVNLRWRACQIRGTAFRELVFVGCDFRDSSFDRCDFTGVTFVNCLLDGVTFSECEILGSVDPLSSRPESEVREVDKIEPAFAFFAPDASRVLRRYLEISTEADWLYSKTSGVPTYPISEATKVSLADGIQVADPHVGGLVMYGGRLSSLSVTRCTFNNGGVLALRHVAGTSLELAEQSSGVVQLFNVAVRGLTVSPPVGTAQSSKRQKDRMEISVVDSTVQNVWFSRPLSGSAKFENCTVWQLFNGSDQGGFAVELVDCGYYGLVNTAEPGGNSGATANFAERGLTAEGAKKVGELARKVDYRSSQFVSEPLAQK